MSEQPLRSLRRSTNNRHSQPIRTPWLLLALLVTPICVLAQDANRFPFVTPEHQGISTDSLNELARIVNRYHEDDLIVGAELLVIKNRRTVLHETFGWRDREERRPMERDTIFNVRSMSKPFTGAAAQILIDEGELQLEDPVSMYLSGFDNARSNNITVKRLLTHRSGLPLSILTSFDEYDSLLEIANAVGARGPRYAPGSRFWYSDSASDVLGAVVEQISGLPLGQFITERLLDPLGMRSSFSFSPGGPEAPEWERMASSYSNQPGVWTKFWQPGERTFYDYAWGSQKLFSTAMDYARFLAMWMDRGVSADGNRILSSEAVERMLSPVSVMGQLGSSTRMPNGFDNLWAFYGQMAVLYAPSEVLPAGQANIVGHSGSDGTHAWCWPDRDLMVLYMTQSRGGVSGLRLEREIDRLLIHPGGAQVIPQEYQPYVGEYRADFGTYHDDTFSVSVLHGNLTVDIPDSFFFELEEPDSRGRMRFALDRNISVSFERDTYGNVTGMNFHAYGNFHKLPRIQATPVSDWRTY